MVKAPGSELRDTIVSLLKLQFSYVVPEHKVANKSADIFYIDDTNPLFQTSIAIECKDWSGSLSSTDIRLIYHDYFPALQSGEIDRLIIIGRVELGKEPRDTLNSLGRVAYISFDQFITSMMNFSYMLQDNILSFRNQDAYKNFMTSSVSNEDISVEARVRDWLQTDEGVLLIYGGYGMNRAGFAGGSNF